MGSKTQTESRAWAEYHATGMCFIRPHTEEQIKGPMGSNAYGVFLPWHGGFGRQCRGRFIENKRVHGGTQDVRACKDLCINTKGCMGISFTPGHCEVWSSRISTSRRAHNWICLTFNLHPVHFLQVQSVFAHDLRPTASLAVSTLLFSLWMSEGVQRRH